MPRLRLISLSALALLWTACVEGSPSQGEERSAPPVEGPSAPPEPAKSGGEDAKVRSERAMDLPLTRQSLRLAGRSVNAFAVDLYGQLRSRSSGDLAFSPASLSVALVMVHAGARGETAEQLEAACHLDPLPPGELHRAFGALLKGWNEPHRGDRLSVASRLYGQEGLPFEADYLELTSKLFGAPLEPVDFSKSPERARSQINDWVSKQTRRHVKELLGPGSISGDTGLALVNAISFSGAWPRAFDKTKTREEPFFVSENQRKPAPMMWREGTYRYRSEEGVEIVELPYVGEERSMFVILPEAVDGLSELEGRLDAEALDRWLSRSSTARVDLKLPRFRLETGSVRLSSELEALGVKAVFDREAADLRGVAEADPRLSLGALVHSALVEVTERGTKAAAATGVVKKTGPPLRPVDFHADHPFLFAIRDRKSGAVLFLGRVVDPT